MTEIKRYDEMYYNGVDEVEDGPLVMYDDHAAIVAALQEQVRGLAAEVSECRRFVAKELGPEAEITFSGLSTERADEVIREIGAKVVDGAISKAFVEGIPENRMQFIARMTEYAARIRSGEQP